MDPTLYKYINEYQGGVSPHIAAKITELIFKNQYVVHKLGKNSIWFEKNADGTLNRIDDVIIRRRLSSDVTNIISQARDNFKKGGFSELNKVETSTSVNRAIESLNISLQELLEKHNSLRLANKIDDCRIIGTQIKDIELNIALIRQKEDIHRSEIRDKTLSGLTELENKLYNYNFKNIVIKELEDIYYQPYN
jgi:hypothetical protein